jgi:hypothetical protein
MALLLSPTLQALILGVVLGTLPSTARQEPLRAKIVYIDAKFGFVVIGKGKKDGIVPGMEFEIVRKTEQGSVTLGKARCEKFLGQDSMAKLQLLEGNPAELRVEDEVLYRLP